LTRAGVAAKAGTTAKTAAAKKAVKAPAKKVVKATAVKTPRKAPAAGSAGSTPSAALAAVIGAEPVARAQVIKKLWDYIKANNLQDATNKRAINADEKLLAVFGKPQVTMFELAGIVGKHLG
jgi:DNA topoisomerase-3